MNPPLEEMKAWLNEKLGREVTISKVRVSGNEGFLVDYMSYGAPATKLVGTTEEEAIVNLFTYLQPKGETKG
jgi:hypothetical protein